MDGQTIYTLEECERLKRRLGLATAVIPTSAAPPCCLMWSVLSVALRSADFLHQIIVVINGDGPAQDYKQAFVADLSRLLKKVVLLRVWGSSGHAQALESAVPWVWTEFYLSMHDDVIVTGDGWVGEARAAFGDRSVALVYHPPLLQVPLHSNGRTLHMPHLNTKFLLCSKPLWTAAGATWAAYDIAGDFNLPNLAGFNEYHGEHTVGVGRTDYQRYSSDIGGWAYHRLRTAGFRAAPLSGRYVRHFCRMSWCDPAEHACRCARHAPEVARLEAELAGGPYADLYAHYRTGEQQGLTKTFSVGSHQ